MGQFSRLWHGERVGNYVMQSFHVRAEMKYEEGSTTLFVANTLIKRCQSTILMVDCNSIRLES